MNSMTRISPRSYGEHLVELAREWGRNRDPMVRQRIAHSTPWLEPSARRQNERRQRSGGPPTWRRELDRVRRRSATAHPADSATWPSPSLDQQDC